MSMTLPVFNNFLTLNNQTTVPLGEIGKLDFTTCNMPLAKTCLFQVEKSILYIIQQQQFGDRSIYSRKSVHSKMSHHCTS